MGCGGTAPTTLRAVPPSLEFLAIATAMASSLRPTLSRGYPGSSAVASATRPTVALQQPSQEAVLRWTGEGLAFSGRVGSGPTVTIDSDAKAGPSSTDSLLLGLMGCMSIDVLMILQKGRVTVNSLGDTSRGGAGSRSPEVLHASAPHVCTGRSFAGGTLEGGPGHRTFA